MKGFLSGDGFSGVWITPAARRHNVKINVFVYIDRGQVDRQVFTLHGWLRLRLRRN